MQERCSLITKVVNLLNLVVKTKYAFGTPVIPQREDRNSLAVAFCLTGSLRAAFLDPHNLFLEPFRNAVLTRFTEAGWDVDIYVVTGSKECVRTRELLQPLGPVAVVCTDDDDLTLAEKRWLRIGPKTSWDRRAFLGQLRKVRLCGGLLLAAEMDRTYQLVARSRLDVRWHAFPSAVHTLVVPGVVWVPWRSSDSMAQYINDRFAIGRPTDMRPYLHAYDALLDRSSWPAHRVFEATPYGFDTEELWETELLANGILARQHRGICFNSLAKDLLVWQEGSSAETEDNCVHRPRRVHPHGYVLDDVLLRIQKKELPGQSEYDPLLTARLLHLWLAEWARIGRPAKIADVGCGRGAMVEQWLRFHPASFVGIDLMPGVREFLGDDLLELDLAIPLPAFGRVRGCRFASRISESFLSPGSISLLRHCCLTPTCRGVNLDQNIFGIAPNYIPSSGDILMKRSNSSIAGVPPWGFSRADWVVSLDVASQIPAVHQRTFLTNLARIAQIGIILVWGAGDPKPALTLLEQLGFTRDFLLEDWMWPFITRERYRQHLLIYRRQESRTTIFTHRCNLVLHSEWSFTADQCHFGESFGCVDSEYIWVSDGCGGLFRRDNDEVACLSIAGHNVSRSAWSYAPKSWQYVECFLPEADQVSIAELSSTSDLDSGIAFCGPSGNDFVSTTSAKDVDMHSDVLISDAIDRTDPLVSLRLSSFAHVDVIDADSRTVIISVEMVPPGVCYAWNLWAAERRVYVRLRKVSGQLDEALPKHKLLRADGLQNELRSLAEEGGCVESIDENSCRRLSVYRKLNLADIVARRLMKRGLMDVYDAIDPASDWGNQSQIWRTVSWVSKMQNSLLEELRRLDEFALLLAVIRFLARRMCAATEDIYRCQADEKLMQHLREASTPWGRLGLQLLLRATPVSLLSPADKAKLLSEVSDGSVWIDTMTEGIPWRLRFARTFLGHYLYHCATLSE